MCQPGPPLRRPLDEMMDALLQRGDRLSNNVRLSSITLYDARPGYWISSLISFGSKGNTLHHQTTVSPAVPILPAVTEIPCWVPPPVALVDGLQHQVPPLVSLHHLRRHYPVGRIRAVVGVAGHLRHENS